MPQEFEGDLQGAVFWGADLSGGTFRDVNLTGVSISHALLIDVDIDAEVCNLVVNGVDVTAYVNERDPWFPLRSHLRPADAESMRHACAAFDTEWSTTISLAQASPEPTLHRSVNGEWSFVQTVRHLVFAIDKWLTVPVLGGGFHPLGLPNSGSVDVPWPELDRDANPTSAEAFAAYRDRVARCREHLAERNDSDLDRPVVVPENGPHRVLDCFRTVFEESFWHLRYARRDMEHWT